MSSAITTPTFQAKIGSIQNQADTSAVYNAGVWSFKNSTALTSVTITDAGNVGIGTSSPDVFGRSDQRNVGVSVAGASDNLAFSLNAGASAGRGAQIYMGGGGTRYFTISSNAVESTVGTVGNTPLRFSTNDTPRMTLDSSGNVGIGTSSPSAALSVNKNMGANAIFRLRNTDSTSRNTRIQLEDYSGVLADGLIDFKIQTAGVASSAIMQLGVNSPAMTLDASGNLLVGATSLAGYSTTSGIYLLGNTPGYFLNNPTNSGGISLALFYSSFSTTNQTKFEVTSEGNVKSRTSSYGGFSDERLKQNITPANSQWDDIKAYEFVKFQMKSEQFSDEENPFMFGVIAQQIEKVSPGLVEEDTKDGMKVVKHSIMFMKAVKALQEAMTRIETLEARLAALEAK